MQIVPNFTFENRAAGAEDSRHFPPRMSRVKRRSTGSAMRRKVTRRHHVGVHRRVRAGEDRAVERQGGNHAITTPTPSWRCSIRISRFRRGARFVEAGNLGEPRAGLSSGIDLALRVVGALFSAAKVARTDR